MRLGVVPADNIIVLSQVSTTLSLRLRYSLNLDDTFVPTDAIAFASSYDLITIHVAMVVVYRHASFNEGAELQLNADQRLDASDHYCGKVIRKRNLLVGCAR